MTKLLPPPINDVPNVRGVGFYVSELEAFGKTPVMLGRRELPAIITPVQAPRYQLGLLQDPDFPSGTDDAHAFLHDANGNKIYRITLKSGTLLSASTLLLHITPLGTTGTAFVASQVDLTGVVTIKMATVWSEPTGGDQLGIDMNTDVTPYVSAGATVTGTQLGFSGSQLTDLRWLTFVAQKETVGTGHVRVLAAAQDVTLTRSGPNDLIGYQMYTFVVDTEAKTVVSAATLVTVDVPFEPHQLARGFNVPLDGTAPREFVWCVGRTDPNTRNPDVGAGSSLPNEGFHTLAGEGIWVTTNVASLNNWTRVWHQAHAQSHNPEEVTVVGTTPTAATPRDIGLAFDQAWQRLIPVGIDTDNSQHPRIGGSAFI